MRCLSLDGRWRAIGGLLQKGGGGRVMKLRRSLALYEGLCRVGGAFRMIPVLASDAESAQRRAQGVLDAIKADGVVRELCAVDRRVPSEITTPHALGVLHDVLRRLWNEHKQPSGLAERVVLDLSFWRCGPLRDEDLSVKRLEVLRQEAVEVIQDLRARSDRVAEEEERFALYVAHHCGRKDESLDLKRYCDQVQAIEVQEGLWASAAGVPRFPVGYPDSVCRVFYERGLTPGQMFAHLEEEFAAESAFEARCS